MRTFAISCAVLTISIAAVAETVMLPMRDGVRLATDLHLPDDGGPAFPVVLVRTVYGRGDVALRDGLNRMGIAFVTQDTRGHGDSEGEKSYFETDGWGPLQDGVDTVEWLKQQPWCNGKIATWGSSALGMTSILLAPATDDLTAQVIHVAPCNFYETYIPGGVPQRALSETYPIVMGYQAAATKRRNHPAYDDYWKHFNAEGRASDITAPGIHIGGWFDLYPQGIIDGFTSRQYHGGPGAKGNQKLIIGPWPHDGGREVGDFTFPESSQFDFGRLARRFLAHWLLGEDMKMPAVHYYILGDLTDPDAPGNEWRTADDWPPYPITPTSFYLTAARTLSTESPATEEALFSYNFDPTNPCPTLGGPNVVISGGLRDQRPISSRDDILRFATEPLTSPVEISGPVTVKLFVSTDAPDTDFAAKLIDIYPDGRELNITEGIQRVKFRNSLETPEFLAPNTVGELEIACESTSIVFNTGHRIGLLISSSNYPRFELNPNSGADRPAYTQREHTGDAPPTTLISQLGADLPPGVPPSPIADQILDPTSVRTAHNTVYMNASRPSALILPLRSP
ncbi:MAG: CocE/NonD family hydrolase [Candidatus Hydrogenedentales bacterium]